MLEQEWDVVVIGAGIHGAGVTQAAAAAGYKVLLLEQYATPAQATSCKSSKLIHGGLRYLESAQFTLVHECLRERSILLSIAPDLVKLKPFYIPVYRSTRRRPWKIQLGLMLYSLFSFRRFHKIKKQYWSELDGLSTSNLDAVFSYYDAQTDDAELTKAVIASAEAIGAVVQYHTRVEGASYVKEGMQLHCEISGEAVSLHTKLVVNATGPWVDTMHNKLVAQKNTSAIRVSLVQGAHIVLPGQVSRPYYLESPHDGRAVFVLPWKDKIMVGTTETEFDGDPADVEATTDEIAYLLTVYNHYFDATYTAEDVCECFAGLRVLPAGDGAAFAKPRETVFVYDDEHSPRVVSILGGKLTAYRATAEKLMSAMVRVLPKKQRRYRTDKLQLTDVQ